MIIAMVEPARDNVMAIHWQSLLPRHRLMREVFLDISSICSRFKEAVEFYSISPSGGVITTNGFMFYITRYWIGEIALSSAEKRINNQRCRIRQTNETDRGCTKKIQGLNNECFSSYS